MASLTFLKFHSDPFNTSLDSHNTSQTLLRLLRTLLKCLRTLLKFLRTLFRFSRISRKLNGSSQYFFEPFKFLLDPLSHFRSLQDSIGSLKTSQVLLGPPQDLFGLYANPLNLLRVRLPRTEKEVVFKLYQLREVKIYKSYGWLVRKPICSWSLKNTSSYGYLLNIQNCCE